MTKDSPDSAFSLGDLLISLRADLEAAKESGIGKSVKFEIEHVDLDLQVVASASGKAGAGVKLSVVGFEFGGDVSSVKTQRLQMRLKLAPGPDGDRNEISQDGPGRPPRT
ncbi:trypco2 family protein [Rhodospirillum sp. A1_3_36]|uniref:trypco2 family protein n=1 Tax=Rhodospirillum sp. A1_3_36 TaxID=3391666 RepID=UPI0039A5124C